MRICINLSSQEEIGQATRTPSDCEIENGKRERVCKDGDGDAAVNGWCAHIKFEAPQKEEEEGDEKKHIVDE